MDLERLGRATAADRVERHEGGRRTDVDATLLRQHHLLKASKHGRDAPHGVAGARASSLLREPLFAYG